MAREWRKADEAVRRYRKELARISRELDLVGDAMMVTFSWGLTQRQGNQPRKRDAPPPDLVRSPG